MKNKILYVAKVGIWRDRVNGNTYHSANITRTRDEKQLFVPLQYGYGDAYKQSCLAEMEKAGWLPKKYCGKHSNGIGKNYLYERENNYPIFWADANLTKKECLLLGTNRK